MIKTGKKEDLCQISLTGVRALIILTMLMKSPCSLEEIKSAFIKYNIMSDSSSYDIIRIDINTLKLMGCEITSARRNTDYKYKLISHPFALELTDDEIKLLRRVYRNIKDELNIEQLMQYDALFRKLAEFVNNNEQKELLLGLSSLKGIDIEEIKQLQQDCVYNRILHLAYRNPETKHISEKDIVAKKVLLKNDKIYLYGFDLNIREAVTLHLKRIKKIFSRKENSDNYSNTSVTIKFMLKNYNTTGLEDTETILSGDSKNGFIVEGIYYNEFLATQRILSFGSSCTVIEPLEFRNKIIGILKGMKEIYHAKGSTKD